ncbi:hypothetical protein chiPu_0003302 [Chiloscyllium punctatum]|uniref:Uncharacterized protein n=1 Tax=Chiloscyllium punctatum TaxID=137246 RepID=A0A401S3G6_CHIPU|nr:hypothetical protein [Chiloscyllium punctatum]
MNKVKVSTEKGNTRILGLLGQLEKINLELTLQDVENGRHITAKLLHLVQTQETNIDGSGEVKQFVYEEPLTTQFLGVIVGE